MRNKFPPLGEISSAAEDLRDQLTHEALQDRSCINVGECLICEAVSTA